MYNSLNYDQEADVIHDANPITCIFPNNNTEKDENTNFDDGDDKNNSPKHNDDTTINIAITNEVICTLFQILIYLY
jgi:hypothetical protein